MTDEIIYHPRYYVTTIDMQGYENTLDVASYPSDDVSMTAHREIAMTAWDKIKSEIGRTYIHAFLYVCAGHNLNRDEWHQLASAS